MFVAEAAVGSLVIRLLLWARLPHSHSCHRVSLSFRSQKLICKLCLRLRLLMILVPASDFLEHKFGTNCLNGRNLNVRTVRKFSKTSNVAARVWWKLTVKGAVLSPEKRDLRYCWRGLRLLWVLKSSWSCIVSNLFINVLSLLRRNAFCDFSCPLPALFSSSWREFSHSLIALNALSSAFHRRIKASG